MKETYVPDRVENQRNGANKVAVNRYIYNKIKKRRVSNRDLQMGYYMGNRTS